MGHSEIHRDDIRFLRAEEVLSRVGLSRTAMYRLIDSGDFPRPVKTHRGGASVRWVESEVTAWQKKRMEDRG